MKIISGGVCAAKGFTASGVHCGIRKNRTKRDISLIISECVGTAAAVYTTNLVKGAPLTVTKNHIADGHAQAIICNSGNANTCNANGIEIAEQMSDLVAKATGIAANDVIVASTGVIGQPLNIEPIAAGIPMLVSELSTEGGEAAAEGITFYYVGLTLGRLLSGFLAKKLSPWRIIGIGQGAVAAAILLLFLPLPSSLSAGVAIFALFLVGLGNGPLYPNMMHLTPENFGVAASQAVVGTQVSAAYVGMLGLPVIFGVLVAWVGAGVVPVMMALLYAILIYLHILEVPVIGISDRCCGIGNVDSLGANLRVFVICVYGGIIIVILQLRIDLLIDSEFLSTGRKVRLYNSSVSHLIICA